MMSAPDSTVSKPNTTKVKTPIILLLVVTLALSAIVLSHYLLPQNTETTEDAYVDGNGVQVTSQISGTVVAISTDNTDHVDAGATVVRLNAVDEEIRFERAKAALAKATRMARIQYSQVEELKAQMDQRRNDVAKAKTDLARRLQLAESGAISKEELSHTQDILKNAQAALVAAQQLLAQRQAMVDGTTLRTHPDILTASSDLRDAYISRERTRIAAPVSGTVTKRNVQVGQRINPGVALMTVVPLDHLWVNANFKESQLEHIRIGQPVKLTADAYGSSVTFHGEVLGLDAGTGSAFALLPAQNATGNWIKITQRVPVKIALNAEEITRNPLRIGLSMKVSVDTSNRKGSVIRDKATSEDVYSTAVFDAELLHADALVESVIHSNEGTGNAVATDSSAR